MDWVDIRIKMPDDRILHRRLPATIERPNPETQQIERTAFDRETKRKVISSRGMFKGHSGTDLWYMRERPDHYYVLHIKLGYGFLRKGRDIFARSICTWTPSQGIDAFDQCLAMDIEDAVLLKELQRPAPRLDIFGQRSELKLIDYMIARGLLVPDPTGQSDGMLTPPPIIIPKKG